LNPEKCIFRVCQGKILGYLVSHRGIEANPNKIQAIMDMAPPQSTKDIQWLIGRLAARNRFISRSAKRSLPFLKTLRGAKDFVWGPEQAEAFESLKQHLSDLATLTSPDPALPLLLYIAASHSAVSAALVQEKERDGKAQQCPVYFVSEVLMSSKCNMTKLEKISYAVIEMEYSAKEPVLMQYLAAIWSLEKQFKGFTLQHVERNKNEEADTLAKAVAKGKALPSDVFYHVI
jgi:hypothetical protein